jgi:hypothetical protein
VESELISTAGFEHVQDGQAVGWDKFGNNSYAVDNSVHHWGSRSLLMSNSDESGVADAGYTLTLKPTALAPIEISGWSKAEKVSSDSNDLYTYSLYADTIITDGTPLWG